MPRPNEMKVACADNESPPLHDTQVLCPSADVAAVWAATARGMGLPALELHGRKSAEYRWVDHNGICVVCVLSCVEGVQVEEIKC